MPSIPQPLSAAPHLPGHPAVEGLGLTESHGGPRVALGIEPASLSQAFNPVAGSSLYGCWKNTSSEMHGIYCISRADSRRCRLGDVKVCVCNVFNICPPIDFEGRKQVFNQTVAGGRVNRVLEMLIKTWRWP